MSACVREREQVCVFVHVQQSNPITLNNINTSVIRESLGLFCDRPQDPEYHYKQIRLLPPFLPSSSNTERPQSLIKTLFYFSVPTVHKKGKIMTAALHQTFYTPTLVNTS